MADEAAGVRKFMVNFGLLVQYQYGDSQSGSNFHVTGTAQDGLKNGWCGGGRSRLLPTLEDDNHHLGGKRLIFHRGNSEAGKF